MRLKLPHLYFTLFYSVFYFKIWYPHVCGAVTIKRAKNATSKICSLLTLFGIVIVILFVIPDTPNGPSLLLGHVL